MKRRILQLLALALVITFSNYSCSNDEPEIIPEPNTEQEEEIDHIQIDAYPNVVDMFELSEFKISTKKVDYNLTIGFHLSYMFDSVVWNMPDIFTNISKDGRSLMSVGYGLSLPGEYKMAVSGYKDGKVVSTDTTTLEVRNNKDFMGLNWNDEKNKEKTFYGHQIEKDSAYIDMSYNWEKTEYALVGYSADHDTKNKENVYPKGRAYLSSLVSKLYGKAIFEYQDKDIAVSPLVSEYESRFKTPLNDLANPEYHKIAPLAIWETRSTNIALISIREIGEVLLQREYFKIIAEPRNK